MKFSIKSRKDLPNSSGMYIFMLRNDLIACLASLLHPFLQNTF